MTIDILEKNSISISPIFTKTEIDQCSPKQNGVSSRVHPLADTLHFGVDETVLTPVSVARRPEKADDYAAIVAKLNADWRFIVCRDRIQWILQRRKGQYAGSTEMAGQELLPDQGCPLAMHPRPRW